MSTSDAATARTWPFWAPSDGAAVGAALDLAGVRAGTRLVDLGCGDGQVLAEAAARGALVGGIEADPDLVVEARSNLTRAGFGDHLLPGGIVLADLFDPSVVLDADVFFAYLAPATLQRLLPRLRGLPTSRLVTVDFAVPGLAPRREHDRARLYDLSAPPAPVGPVGWPSAGTLVATVPDVQSLSCLELVHPAGPTRLRASAPLADVATILAGADRLDRPGAVAVDLRWEGPEAGAFVGGSISSAGAGSHAVFAVFGADEDMWELDEVGVSRLRGALRRRHPPSTIAEVLAVADGEA